MKIEYVDITNKQIDTELLTCQCGAHLVYVEKLGKLVCSNPNCIKRRMSSVMSTLRALDIKTKDNHYSTKLEQLAIDNYDALTDFVDKHNISIGAEIITKGLNLNALGTLGTQLGTVIDNTFFEIKDLSTICGSELLEKFTVDFSKISNNQRQAIVDINTQLGIDGTVWLANLLYSEFIRTKQIIVELAQYLTLIQFPNQKRSPIVETSETTVSSGLTSIDLIGTAIIHNTSVLEESQQLLPSDELEDGAEENINMEDILAW